MAENGEGKPSPARTRAAGRAEAAPAASLLKEYKPAKQNSSRNAKDDLDAAKKELDDALANLRQQLQDEVLRALEGRFTAMLAKQRELSIQTKTLDKNARELMAASDSCPRR
jgi:hypothetical protein